jgi:ABC-type multidrug transport system fused ATPase/permease subunit
MPDRKRDEVSNFPPYLGGGRKAVFLLLLLLVVCETAAQVWTGYALTSVIRGSAATAWPIASLITAFSLLAAFFWARGVTAEWIGQDYVNDVRAGLARQAVRSALGRGRLGTITARMSADLAALKNWSDAGICGALTGLLTLVAGLVSVLMNVGINGLLSCLAGPVVSLLLVLVFWGALGSRIRRRRAARGLLSARTGDAVFAAKTAAVFSDMEYFVRPIRRAGSRLAEISVRTLSLVQLLRASSTVTVPAGILLFVFLDEGGFAVPASAWGGLIYSLGLCTSGIALLLLAVEALIERRIAIRKLRELEAQATEAPALAPDGDVRIPRKPVLPLSIDGRIVAGPGDVAELSRAAFPGLALRLMQGGEGVRLGELSSGLIDPRDWARRVAVVTENVPLARGGLRVVVRSRGRPTRRQVRDALRLAGIDPDDSGLPSVIDPQRHMIEPGLMARLRLTRGLVASPHVLVIDEPWLAADPELKQRLSDWAQKTGSSVIWLNAM